MKLFIDTANLDHICEAHELGIVNGVTTNRDLIGKEGLNSPEEINRRYKEICQIMDGDVTVEIMSKTFYGMISEGQMLADLHPRIVINIPMTNDGIKAIRYLNKKGIKTNCIKVFSPASALMAAKCGATYVSPFIDLAYGLHIDRSRLIYDIGIIYENNGFPTRVFAPTVRDVLHFVNSEGFDGGRSMDRFIVSLPYFKIGVKMKFKQPKCRQT